MSSAGDDPTVAILAIPVEILLKVFLFLPASSLFSLRAVCQIFADIIDGTSSAQYKIKLAAWGYDGVEFKPSSPRSNRIASQMTPAERVARLEAHVYNFSSLQGLDNGHRYRIPSSLCTDITQGMLALLSPLDSATVTLLELPSRHTGLNRLRTRGTKKLEFVVSEFAMDPSQDLIVFLQPCVTAQNLVVQSYQSSSLPSLRRHCPHEAAHSPEDVEAMIVACGYMHVRKLSDVSSVHPSATDSEWCVVQDFTPHLGARLQIYGNIVIMLTCTYPYGSMITVSNWTVGGVIGVRYRSAS